MPSKIKFKIGGKEFTIDQVQKAFQELEEKEEKLALRSKVASILDLDLELEESDFETEGYIDEVIEWMDQAWDMSRSPSESEVVKLIGKMVKYYWDLIEERSSRG